MKKNKSLCRKQLTAACCIVSMLFGLTACGSSNGTSSGQTTTSAATSEKSDDNGAGVNSEGYPIVNDKITLTLLDCCHNMQGNSAELPLWDRMEELTNIHAEVEVVPYSNVLEKVQLRMASGTMPDIIFGENIMSDSQLSKYAADGSLLRLNDLIDEYAPNLAARLEEYPELKEFITLPDGGIYSLPFYDPVNGVANEIISGTFVNVTWLKKLGLEIPETLDEYEAMLYAFKEQDPNGNGIADEIPYVSHPNVNTLFNDMTTFSSMGIQTLLAWGYKDLMCIKNGEVRYMPATDEFKTALTYLRRWYQDGLMEPENATISPSELDSNLKAEPDVYGSVVTQSCQNLMYASKIDVDTGDYQVIPPLKNENGEQFISMRASTATRAGAVITTDCQNPEAALRWLDYFYGEEGGLYACYGEQGVVWDYNSDGKVETLKPEDETIGYDQWWRSNSVNVPGIIPKGITENVLMRESWRLKYLQMQKLEPYATMEFTWPQLVFSPEDSDVIALYEQDLLTYVQQSMADFVMSPDADIEGSWNTYISNLKSIGLDQLLEVYQKRYGQQYN
ncbi:MAG: extracellular solute-binding protein [Clostridiales bacterium]|nr:extracellular solute-binding protein [Clostridiales bacterium]